MLRLRTIVAASIALFAAALAFVLSTSNEPRVAVRRASPEELPAPAATIPAAPSSRSEAVSVPASRSQDEWTADDAPIKVAQRYREAKDKREFFERAVKVGGGANLYFALEALNRCSKVNQLGMVGAEQDMIGRISVNDATRSKRIDAYRGFIRGCEGFEMKRVSRQELLDVSRKMYEAGDAMGRANNLRPYPDEAETYDQQRTMARELLETRDPYVLKFVAPYLAGRRAGRITWDQFVAGGPAVDAFNREVNAWNLALCELGMDCTPAGSLGPLSCFSVGKCEWSSVDEIAPLLATSGGLAPVPGRKDEIVAAVRAGNWEKLGL